jgi:hypothetical protein
MLALVLGSQLFHPLKLKHAQRIDNLYKFIIYEGDEEYFTLCTPECAHAIDQYLQYRERFGEKIGPNSPENIVVEADKQSPASNFVAWLESYVSNQGEREEGVTWMYSSDRSSIFITKSILESYKVHCSRASTTAFQSLEQLAKSITADLKMSVGVYPTGVGRAEVKDGSGKIIREARPWIKKKVVRVPIGIIQKTLLNNADV